MTTTDKAKRKNGLTNRQCGVAAANMQSFRNGNKTLWGEYRTAQDGTKFFVTFSYNTAWPLTAVMLIQGSGAESAESADKRYFVNTDKYSVTTTRHASLVRPWHAKQDHISHVTREELYRLVMYGYTSLVRSKLEDAA